MRWWKGSEVMISLTLIPKYGPRGMLEDILWPRLQKLVYHKAWSDRKCMKRSGLKVNIIAFLVPWWKWKLIEYSLNLMKLLLDPTWNRYYCWENNTTYCPRASIYLFIYLFFIFVIYFYLLFFILMCQSFISQILFKMIFKIPVFQIILFSFQFLI